MSTPARICPKPGCPHLVNRRYCPAHERAYEAQRGTAHQRGYDHTHRKTRTALDTTVQAGTTPCVICGLLIQPEEPWHLDHTPDRDGYRGAAHASCNTRDGGQRGRATQQ